MYYANPTENESGSFLSSCSDASSPSRSVSSAHLSSVRCVSDGVFAIGRRDIRITIVCCLHNPHMHGVCVYKHVCIAYMHMEYIETERTRQAF